MSISPAQMAAPAGSTKASEPSSQSAPVSTPQPVEPENTAAGSAASAGAIAISGQLTTERCVDKQHQVYYEFVDERTGSVLFEFPPAALREIGENLNVPLIGDSSASGLDVKS